MGQMDMSKIIELNNNRSAKNVIADLSNSAQRIKHITAIVTYTDGTFQMLTDDDKSLEDLCLHQAIIQNEVQYFISTSYESDA
jgi:hypothetical protein